MECPHLTTPRRPEQERNWFRILNHEWTRIHTNQNGRERTQSGRRRRADPTGWRPCVKALANFRQVVGTPRRRRPPAVWIEPDLVELVQALSMGAAGSPRMNEPRGTCKVSEADASLPGERYGPTEASRTLSRFISDRFRRIRTRFSSRFSLLPEQSFLRRSILYKFRRESMRPSGSDYADRFSPYRSTHELASPSPYLLRRAPRSLSFPQRFHRRCTLSGVRGSDANGIKSFTKGLLDDVLGG